MPPEKYTFSHNFNHEVLPVAAAVAAAAARGGSGSGKIAAAKWRVLAPSFTRASGAA
ncbi:MAG: hypothetical protein LBS59_00375 [Puniceicoccales bacterium]|jgi:hypothetical protein|nr:hypothetical protein [Puniceicoccales bacterium]